jgi:DNA invertase Pin-like site-specific DNA recombinase/transposase
MNFQTKHPKGSKLKTGSALPRWSASVMTNPSSPYDFQRSQPPEMEPKAGFELPALYLPPSSALPPEKTVYDSTMCVIYARLSTPGQRETSIERQHEYCGSYAKRRGLRVIAIYADHGVSGTTTERDELKRLLEDGKRGRFAHVVVESLDRLARKLSIAVKIFEELLSYGIAIHDAEEDRPLNIFDIGQKGAASQAARDLLVRRNQSGKRKGAALGNFGVASCFGYERCWDPEKQELVWRVNAAEKAIIIEAFELFAAGDSAARITALFNERPLSERGKPYWERGDLVGDRRIGSGLLRRLRYIGLRVHGRAKLVKVKGKLRLEAHPISNWVVGELDASLRIVPQDLFDRVQRMLNERADAAAAGRPAVPRYSAKHSPLRGLIRCFHCGAGMTPTQKRRDGKPRLLCNNARNKTRCINSRSFTLEAVEDEVHRILVEHLGTPDALLPYINEYNDSHARRMDDVDEDRKDVERDRQSVIKEMDSIRRDEAENRYPLDFLEQRRLEANIEYEKVEKRLAELAHEASTEVDSAERLEAHRMLLGSIRGVFSDNFATMSETGTKVVARLRRLIHSIVLDIGETGCGITLKCRMVLEWDDSEANLATFKSRLDRNTGAWEVSVREVRRVAELAENGRRSVTDDEWRAIGHLVPDCVAMSKRGGPGVDKRRIVDAALLHLWEGVPLLRMPSAYGPSGAVFAGLKRLSASGGWDAVADALHKISPGRIPNVHSEMFETNRRSPSSALKGLPLIRARHGLSAAAGKHAPSEEAWQRVRKFIPEQVLQMNKEAAGISPRTFLHGILYWLRERIPMSHLPLMFGSLNHFNHAVERLARHGGLDKTMQALLEMAPSPLDGADPSMLDRFARPTKEAVVWRRALPKRADMQGMPEHYPDDRTWSQVRHLFPSELLFCDERAVIAGPRVLAHAILYRVREKIPFRAMPAYFGDPHHIERVVTKWVFHHLWEEFRRVLDAHDPEILKGADLRVFKQYKRGRRFRYRHLFNSEPASPPAHEPSGDDFAMMRDLIPIDVLTIRGGPAIMEPERFFHAVCWMLKERTLFGGLPPYFGKNYDVRVATRRFVMHHLWDTMRARIEHFEPEWAACADLTIFDTLKRSKNPEPGFRRPRNPRVFKKTNAVAPA